MEHSGNDSGGRAPYSRERRRFLVSAGSLGGAALLGGTAPFVITPRKSVADPNGRLEVPEWTLEQGDPILDPPYGEPSPYEEDVVRTPTDITPTRESSWSFTPHQHLDGTITPNGLFFERHHGGVPEIDPDRHRLVIHGMVDRPLELSMNDLMRFPAVSRIHFIECSGNTLTEWDEPTGETVQPTHGLVSCAEWTGVSLGTILQECGVQPEARWLLLEGADAAAMTRSFPLGGREFGVERDLDDYLLVWRQNGEMLRPEQGYPLRFLATGMEGNIHIKWLRRIKVSDQPWHTREETSKYTDLIAPEGVAYEHSLEMDVKSVITWPSAGQQLTEQGFHEISGIAWSGRGRIVRVDVSTDGGRSWHRARLEEPVLDRCLTRFRYPWQWNGESTILQSRAIDETGLMQPTRDALVEARGVHSVYHYNAIQSWKLEENGGLKNVHA